MKWGRRVTLTGKGAPGQWSFTHGKCGKNLSVVGFDKDEWRYCASCSTCKERLLVKVRGYEFANGRWVEA
jgi:DNA-directed RNA polymerase subunit RPC12/RpoP